MHGYSPGSGRMICQEGLPRSFRSELNEGWSCCGLGIMDQTTLFLVGSEGHFHSQPEWTLGFEQSSTLHGDVGALGVGRGLYCGTFHMISFKQRVLWHKNSSETCFTEIIFVLERSLHLQVIGNLTVKSRNCVPPKFVC